METIFGRASRTFAVSVAFLPCLGCGARTPLLEPSVEAGIAPADAAGTDTSLAPDSAKPDVATDSPADVADAGEAEAPPVVLPCVLASAGDPIPVLKFNEKHTEAPSLVVLDPGQPPGPSGERAAVLAIQGFASGGSYEPHDDVRLARLRIEPPWPAGVVEEKPPVTYGQESHGWGEMSHAPGSINGLGLAWHSDMGGHGRPVFRAWDVASWSPAAPVDIASQGEAVLDLAPGASTGQFGVGYAGDGYAVTWRNVDYNADSGSPTRPVVAVLDSVGNVMLGPHAAAGYLPYPGKSPSLVWTGATYLVAVSYGTCPAGDPLCAERSVVISRFRPASGDAYDDSGIEQVSVFKAISASSTPLRPAIASWGGTTWLGWFEADPNDDKAPRTLRVVRLGPQGDSMGATLQVTEQAMPISALGLSASEVGVALTWAEQGDTSLPQSKLGHSRITVRLLDMEGVEHGPPVIVPATSYNDYGWTPSVGIAHPRGLMVTWSGMDLTGGYWRAFLGRLSCQGN